MDLAPLFLDASEAEARQVESLGQLSLAAIAAEVSDLYQDQAAALIRYATSYAGDPESARDAVQDSFIRYLELRRAGIELKEPKAWLTRVVKNRLIDMNRRESRQDEVDAATAHGLTWYDPAANSGQLEAIQLWQLIGTAVSPKELACLRLRADGLSYAEISRALGVQPGTVSMLLTRGREKAATLLQPRPTK